MFAARITSILLRNQTEHPNTAAFLAVCGGDIKGAVATGHRRLASIRSLFSFAHALGYVRFNHAASVDGVAATGSDGYVLYPPCAR